MANLVCGFAILPSHHGLHKLRAGVVGDGDETADVVAFLSEAKSEVAALGDTVTELHQQVTGSLGGPRTGRVCGHPEQISPAGTMRNGDQRRESRQRRSFVAVYGQDLVAAVIGGASLAEGVDQSRRVSTQAPGSSSLTKVLQNYSLD